MRVRLPISLTALATAAASWLSAGHAEAAKPYLVVRDEQGLVGMSANPPDVVGWRTMLLDAYEAAGLPLPEVLSVWTSFPMGGNNVGTIIDPRSNEVSGIGLPVQAAAQDLRAILWHNNIHALPQRAELHRAPLEGYARYLFLLELSHLWGPQIDAPPPDTGDLIGFSYHWSFFLDQPGPAGGNAWVDNEDGTFTVVPGDPATVSFSLLDLYLMGLVAPSEVPPFGVLTAVTVPEEPSDPFWGGAYEAHSFPWFDTENEPLTVTATRRELTIDDVVEANGVRSPAAGVQTSWTIGFVLMVGQNADDTAIAEAETAFEPIVNGLVPAFAAATGDRGTLELQSVPDGEGGQGGAGLGGSSAATGGSPNRGAPGDEDAEGCACRTTPGSDDDGGAALGLGLAALALLASRRRRG
jgi:MYXO-CTERM domain-containing protein